MFPERFCLRYFMATVKPFPALRPRPDLAGRICELPYDVMSSEEARLLARDNPLSFLHVSKPEIDLPPDVDPCAPEVYAQGQRNLAQLVDQGALRQDKQDGFYLYRQIMGRHSQLGLVAAARCEEYLQGTIKKHELTRPDKENDRVRHMEALQAQTGPVFLTYRAQPELNVLFDRVIAEKPEVDFTAPDGVRHTSWNIFDPATLETVEQTFARIPALYIADGHHRSAAAARVFQARHGAGPSSRFLAVLFPHDQMQILPYNRLVKDLHGLTPADLLRKLETVFGLKENGTPVPARKHELGLFLEGRWWTLNIRPKFAATQDPVERLDVTLLQKHVLEPLLGIGDPRTSERIAFVGGIRGTGELEKRVASGEFACAFSLFPTSVEDLMTVADAGGSMPPKSTWFEPKLRDGMFSHLLY
jgi:uncharacterized protein (DUF1015 family)